MTRKQSLILLCGSTVLIALLALMIFFPQTGIVSADDSAAPAIQETGDTPSLSGGNDCYCSPGRTGAPDTSEPESPSE